MDAGTATVGQSKTRTRAVAVEFQRYRFTAAPVVAVVEAVDVCCGDEVHVRCLFLFLSLTLSRYPREF